MSLKTILKKLRTELFEYTAPVRSINSISSDIYYELQNKESITKEDIKKAAEKYGFENIDSEQIVKIAKDLKRHGIKIKS